jgi:hypothetical protein
MPRLGDILIKSRQLTESQLQTAIQEQRRWGGLLGEVLLRLNYVSESVLVKAVTRQTGVAEANVAILQYPDPAAQAKLPLEQATRLRALPLQLKDGGKLLITGMVEPHSATILEELRKVTGCRILPQLIGPQTFLKLLSRHYGSAGFHDDSSGGNYRMVDPDAPTADESPMQPSALELEGSSPKSRPPMATNGALAAQTQGLVDALSRIEATQRNEVAVLRAMVELLIERGVFSREEYLARVRK